MTQPPFVRRFTLKKKKRLSKGQKHMELNYAIFGVGRIGVVHAQIAKSHGCTVVAIGDENSQAISSALEALQMDAEGTETFTSAQEMARACERMAVKFVVVASHTHMHAKHAMAFVDCGLPVYMEKPLTADLSEAFDFCQRVESRAGKSVQIGLQRRFDDALCYAHTLRSEIGVLREIRCVLRDQFPPPPTYTSRSLIVDMGVHVTDEGCFFLFVFFWSFFFLLLISSSIFCSTVVSRP